MHAPVQGGLVTGYAGGGRVLHGFLRNLFHHPRAVCLGSQCVLIHAHTPGEADPTLKTEVTLLTPADPVSHPHTPTPSPPPPGANNMAMVETFEQLLFPPFNHVLQQVMGVC